MYLIELGDIQKAKLIESLVVGLQYGMGSVFRKYSKDAESICSGLFSALREETKFSERPIVPIDINPVQMEKISYSSYNANYDDSGMRSVYEHIFNKFLEAMEDSPLKDTEKYRQLVNMSSKDLRNVFHKKDCSLDFYEMPSPKPRTVLKGAPVLNGGKNIGANLKNLSLAMVEFKELSDKDIIYKVENIPYGKSIHLEDFPRVIFNLVGFPIIESLNYEAWDKQVQELKEGTAKLPQKSVDESLKRYILNINGFLDGLMNGGEGCPRSVAYPGWVTDLSDERPHDSKIMDLGFDYGNIRVTTEMSLSEKTNFRV